MQIEHRVAGKVRNISDSVSDGGKVHIFQVGIQKKRNIYERIQNVKISVEKKAAEWDANGRLGVEYSVME